LLLDLVHQQLQGRQLDLLLNTHLHSDHCGGNAALAARYPALQTWIAPGEAQAVAQWDEQALHFRATGQHCPRFAADRLLQAGERLELGGQCWEVHAAPGHDPHSVVLFAPSTGVLVSADALWENGFGVVFPELEGLHAFAEVGATLDLIEGLQPKTVIPGHGAVFGYRPEVMARARQRLASFVNDPQRHAQHAVKVLLKYKLLEVQQQALPDFMAWACSTAYMQALHRNGFAQRSIEDWLISLLADLQKVGAAQVQDGLVMNQG
jgi:glyoxylase-like metal-dependent hydrolase (beta-lactamase superfamily II)